MGQQSTAVGLQEVSRCTRGKTRIPPNQLKSVLRQRWGLTSCAFLIPTEGEDRTTGHLSLKSATEHVHRAPQAGTEAL
jgi:hypothetical protein